MTREGRDVTRWMGAAPGLAAVLVAAVLLAPSSALAAPVLSTSFPGVTVQAGKTVDFPLTIHESGSGRDIVHLSVTGLPKGWSGRLQGGGNLVDEAYIAPGSPSNLDLQLKVPASAGPGVYQLSVAASAGGSVSRLPLSVRVSSAAVAKPTLTAQYPALKGSSSSSFQFQLTLANNGLSDQNFALTSKAPTGWQVTFSPGFGSKEIGAIPVKAGQSQTLNVTAKPPANASPGTYKIMAEATTKAGDQASVPLQVILTGTENLNVTTSSGQLNAKVTDGATTGVPIVIQNTGSADLQNISLTSSAPNGWTVTFSPSSIASLQAGGQKQVVMNVAPGSHAIAGDYDVTATASTPSTSASQDFRVTVQASSLWGWIGVLIVLVVLAGLGYLFRRLGRR